MKTLIIILIAVALGSCGTVKRFKERHEIKDNLELSTKSETKKTDKTVTRITEKIDTVVPIKEDSVVLVRPLEEVLEGNPIVATDGNNTVKVFYDQETSTIRATGITEAHDVPVFVERETEVENDIRIDDKKAVEIDKEVSIETEVKKVDKEGSKGFNVGFWTAMVLLLLVICLLFYLEKRRNS